MKRNFFTSFVVAALVLGGIAEQLQAQDFWCPNCWYVSGFAGPTSHREMDIQITDNSNTLSPFHLITGYRTGYGVGGAIGAVFCRNWRLEVEGYFRNNEGKSVDFPTGIGFNVDYDPHFHYHSFSLMANGFYDFCLCEPVTWYVGGGIGPSWVQFKTDPIGDLVLMQAKKDDVRFSYQIMTGIAYQLFCHLSVTVGYRLWGTVEKSFSGKGLLGTPSKFSEKRIPIVQSVEFGLRYAF